MSVRKNSIKERWDKAQPIEEWAKNMVRKWNHDQRIAIMEEFNRITREEHAVRVRARETEE